MKLPRRMTFEADCGPDSQPCWNWIVDPDISFCEDVFSGVLEIVPDADSVDLEVTDNPIPWAEEGLEYTALTLVRCVGSQRVIGMHVDDHTHILYDNCDEALTELFCGHNTLYVRVRSQYIGDRRV